MSNLDKKIKNLLAEQLGLNPEDIKDEDSLESDLHMVPTDISDLMKTLEEEGYNISKLDFSEIDSFADLVEDLESNNLLE